MIKGDIYFRTDRVRESYPSVEEEMEMAGIIRSIKGDRQKTMGMSFVLSKVCAATAEQKKPEQKSPQQFNKPKPEKIYCSPPEPLTSKTFNVAITIRPQEVPNLIAQTVCDCIGIDLFAMKTRSRKRNRVMARSLTAFLIKWIQPAVSLKDIAKVISSDRRYDHSSVIHIMQRVTDYLQCGDPALCKAMSIIQNNLRLIYSINVDLNDKDSFPDWYKGYLNRGKEM